jgi:ABC-2 type transport system ATP-binding protein
MTYPIEADGLQRSFGDVEAVVGVDLEVRDGEVFGFLGPNGAGKSTTVRMLTTLLRPTGGHARVAGWDVATQADQVRRSIGVALQDAAIDPLMTGNELLRLQATLHGIGRADARRRGTELLERVGLTAAGDRRVGGYSGGMRRRLDLALSLVHEPAVLFLDEPTTGLDPMSRVNLWEELRSLNAERGTTVFLTTQYLEEADQLAGRIAIIDHGRIVREGTPAKLKAEVGAPTLVLRVHAEHRDLARKALAALLGSERPSGSAEDMAFGLEGGAGRMAEVVRALDEVGAVIEHLELAEPSLDDVFAEATGRRLEGAGDDRQDDATGDAVHGDGEAGDGDAVGSAPAGNAGGRKRR